MTHDARRWSMLSDLFDELVELSTAACALRLEEIARDDASMAAEVVALLEADSVEGGVIDEGVAVAVPELLSDVGAECAGSQIGDYRLLAEIGEGGMGVVWLAERSDGAYEQQVAVKLLKRGMDTHAILRRFLLERRILARLQHKHIVRLLDGGMSSDGRPFYVMDHVVGEPITTYATRHTLDVRARVELLVKVAEAVAFAHAQLVVHRDIKPSNILVSDDGEPRVLDFGIAKLLEDTGEQTMTGTGLRVLSPAYAAPEQILGEPIGTATDVYALGLLLCELLTGELPTTRRSSERALSGVEEITTRASALVTRTPDQRISQMYGAGVDSRRIARSLSGDIDVIIAKALQREPSRRYAGAQTLANDLKCWMKGLPISARADSGWYRLRRFTRRHKMGVAASALVLLSLVGGLGAALWQARIARAEAERAEMARAQAEHQLQRSERVKQFILALFREQDPVARAKAQARTPAELIRAGVEEVELSLDRQPELQAELLRDLGEIQVVLDEPARARATLQKALDRQIQISGESSVESAEARAVYGDALYMLGETSTAAPLLREALQQLQDGGRGERPKAAQAAARLAMVELAAGNAQEAERLARDALSIDREHFGEQSLQVAQRLSTLGNVLMETSRYDDALRTYREALQIVVKRGGDDHARAALLRTYIGDALRMKRRYAEALPEYEAAVRIERLQLPAGHSILGSTLTRLGDLQRRMQRFDEAERSLSEASGILRAASPAQYAQSLQHLAALARAKGEFDLAADRYEDAFVAFHKATGDSIYTWLTLLGKVQVLIDAHRLAEADAVAIRTSAGIARLPEDAYLRLYESNVLANLRHDQGRFDEAIPQRRHALDALLKMYGVEHVEVQESRVRLALSLIALGDEKNRLEASRLLDEAGVALRGHEAAEAEAVRGYAGYAKSRLHSMTGDREKARDEITQAIPRLKRPMDVRMLRDAQALAKQLGVRDG